MRSQPDGFLAKLPYLLCACAFALLCGVTMKLVLHDPLFWDARVYSAALGVFRSGGNPYLEAANYGFVYPPAFLFVHRFVSAVLPGRIGWCLYAILVLASTASIPWMLAEHYIRARWFTPLLACVLFTMQPRLLAEIGLLSGNLATPFYAFTLAAGVPGLRRNRWLLFYLVVVLAALIKPQYLAFLLLPQLAGTRQRWQPALSAAIAGAGYGLQRLSMPVLFANFRQAVAAQVLGKEDVGFGIFSYLFKLSHRATLAEAGHIAALGVVVIVLIALRRRAAPSPLWVPLLLVTIILANPRLLQYDAQVAVLPALLLCVECARAVIDRRRSELWIALPAASILTLLSMNGRAGVCLLLATSVGAAVIALWTEPRRLVGAGIG